jgi:ribosomal protein L44E
MEQKRICPDCQVEKSFSEFYVGTNRKDGTSSYCKNCISKRTSNYAIKNSEQTKIWKKDWKTKNKERVKDYNNNWKLQNLDKQRSYYKKSNLKIKCTEVGITIEQFIALEKLQNGLCLLCKKKPLKGKELVRLYIDHNHKTGEFRGLLCMKCNFLPSMCDDDPTILTRMIDYVSRTKEDALKVLNEKN